MNLEDMKAAIGYEGTGSKRANYLNQLTEGQLVLVEAFGKMMSEFHTSGSAKSAKSRVARFLVEGKLAEGKTGDSMKSAVKAFIDFVDGIQAAVEFEELDS